MKNKPAQNADAPPPTRPKAIAIQTQLPDVNTAAALAAALAAGRPIDKSSAADLAKQAVDLWQATKREIGKRAAEALEARDKGVAWVQQFDGVPRDVQPPLSWLEFGKSLCPASKDDDIATWLRSFADAEKFPIVEKIETLPQYFDLARRFLAWRKLDAEAMRSAKGKKGAAARHEKGAKKKRLPRSRPLKK